jgi:hypothetical protein
MTRALCEAKYLVKAVFAGRDGGPLRQLRRSEHRREVGPPSNAVRLLPRAVGGEAGGRTRCDPGAATRARVRGREVASQGSPLFRPDVQQGYWQVQGLSVFKSPRTTLSTALLSISLSCWMVRRRSLARRRALARCLELGFRSWIVGTRARPLMCIPAEPLYLGSSTVSITGSILHVACTNLRRDGLK